MKQGIIEAVQGFSFELEANEGVLNGQQLIKDKLGSAVEFHDLQKSTTVSIWDLNPCQNQQQLESSLLNNYYQGPNIWDRAANVWDWIVICMKSNWKSLKF